MSALPSIINSEMMQTLREDYIKVQGEYQEHYANFKDDHPS